jgi:hypothetical protein
MEENYKAARDRESRLKSRARRRADLVRREWATSIKGNPYLKTRDFLVVLFKRGNSWSGAITNRQTDRKVFAKREYATLDEAKLAALKAMDRLKDR